MEAGIPGNAWERGVCSQLRPTGTRTCAATKAARAFLLALSFFGYFYFFFRREKFFQGFIPSLCPGTILWSPWEKRWGWILDASLPCLPFRERWDELLSLLAEFECWSPNISCARDLFQSLGPSFWMGGIFPAVLGGVFPAVLGGGCCLTWNSRPQRGENSNIPALMLLLFSHSPGKASCFSPRGEAPLLPALIPSFAVELLLIFFFGGSTDPRPG